MALINLISWDLTLELLLHIGSAALLTFLGFFIAKYAAKGIDPLFTRHRIDPILCTFFKKVLFYAIFSLFIISALGCLGFSTASFVAVAGGFGLSLGFVFKDYFVNLGGGIMLHFIRPFSLGDLVKVSNEKGRVESINFFTTTLIAEDKTVVIIPNAKILSDAILKYPL